MVCSHCGAKMMPGAKKCPSCGYTAAAAAKHMPQKPMPKMAKGGGKKKMMPKKV